jgi:hypothetical protein
LLLSSIDRRLLTPLVSLELQDLSTIVDDHQSYPTTVERHHPTPFAPPHRRHIAPVRLCPLLLARHLPCGPLEISGNTSRLFQPAAYGRPSRPMGCSLGPVFGPVLCPGI